MFEVSQLMQCLPLTDFLWVLEGYSVLLHKEPRKLRTTYFNSNNVHMHPSFNRLFHHELLHNGRLKIAECFLTNRREVEVEVEEDFTSP